ncbi:uncharacterized protein LOC121994127 [Zingiber officinale]|uniref:Uncharacterized protein n=1 Tax=Zingiber officinale TaxID=94328 RepID=A0A8J5G443_ZINOF|nr:uncharacterized protein LOC121994127 [Zingiber officinale]KAG6500085.1 hypothetical protein ZIOFF_039899 [Zingiber officinale]
MTMMLRSSSTPLLGSLLSSPGHHHHASDSPHHHHPFTCQFCPPSASDSAHDSAGFLRRTLSEGNLRSVFSDDLPSKSSSAAARRAAHPSPHGISSSLYNPTTVAEEDEAREDDVSDEELDFVPGLKRCESGSPALPPLFLARGLGIDRLGSGLLTASVDWGSSIAGGLHSDVEAHFKKMVEENPSNALFLRNYAEFLYQTKGDLRRAEEYYSRAILAEPDDGETLSQYATVVWELHHDVERASSYFQQAVQAAPQDSHVFAAYAGFLWETEEDVAEESIPFATPDFAADQGGMVAPVTA